MGKVLKFIGGPGVANDKHHIQHIDLSMNRIMKGYYLVLIACVFVRCDSKEEAEASEDNAIYVSEIQAWDQQRARDLKGSKGWLNLAGLFWLEDGINTVGSGSKNSIVFPEGRIPERAGFFMVKGNKVVFEAAPVVAITSKGRPIKRMVVFQPDSAARNMEYGMLQWFIIKRDNKFGIRLRDFESPALANFKGIKRYPIDSTWRLQAKFKFAWGSRKIDITNIVGQAAPQLSPGPLVFKINSTEYQLDVIDEGSAEYFVIFGDSTNAHETYGAGRYIYVNKPDADGNTIIDFNKAQNPPCAFTPFATCPLPPRQNILEVAVRAGEKNYSDH